MNVECRLLYKFQGGKFNRPVFASIFQYLPVFTGKNCWYGKYSYLPAFCQPCDAEWTLLYELFGPVHFQFKGCLVSFDYYHVLLKCL